MTAKPYAPACLVPRRHERAGMDWLLISFLSWRPEHRLNSPENHANEEPCRSFWYDRRRAGGSLNAHARSSSPTSPGNPSTMTAAQILLSVGSGGLVGLSLGVIGGGGSILAAPLIGLCNRHGPAHGHRDQRRSCSGERCDQSSDTHETEISNGLVPLFLRSPG
jgi:hypothetical protein